MLNRFEDTNFIPDSSRSSGDFSEIKTNTQLVSKLNDSFDSSFMIQGSEHSVISQSSFIEDSFLKPKNLTLNMPKTTKHSTPLRQVISVARPVSTLKTTFLPDDAANYDFPKKISTPKVEPRFKKEIMLQVEDSDKVTELENQIIKKDALIETLRNRVAKMVEELEEVNRKKHIKNPSQEEEKFQELKQKYEESERKIQVSNIKEKDFLQLLDKREKENQCLLTELNAIKFNSESDRIKLSRLESEVSISRDQKDHLLKENDSLKHKIETLSKSADLMSSQKFHLDQEIAKLQALSKTLENDLKANQEDSSKSIHALSLKLHQSQEDLKQYQALLQDSQMKYDSLTRSHNLLSQKLKALEEQLCNIDETYRKPLKERAERNSISPKLLERQFTFNSLENTRETLHKKSHSNASCSKTVLKEIMDYLEVTNTYEIVPNIKRLGMSPPEKKLLRKISSLIREFVYRDPSKEVTPAQIWRLIKRIFEDHACVIRNLGISDIQKIRNSIGDASWSEKIVVLVNEHKILKDIFAKIQIKLRLPVNSTFTDLEIAINNIRL